MRQARALIGALVGLTLVGGGTAAAHAQDALLSVSHDGRTYAAEASFDLFADVGRLVPGDAVADEVWVRNDATTAGRVRIDIVNARTDDAALAAATAVTFEADSAPSRTVTVADAVSANECLVVGADIVLQPGESARIDASLAMSTALGDEGVGNAGALGSVSFDVRAILADASVPGDVFPGTTCSLTAEPEPTASPSGDALPATGAPVMTGIAASGLFALAIGTVVVIAHRRRTARER